MRIPVSEWFWRTRHVAALALPAALLTAGCARATRHRADPAFSVLALVTGKQDQAHISFLGEAVKWVPAQAAAHGFAFDTTSDWSRLNDSVLARHQVVVFLDTRPEFTAQRAAFQRYGERGGAWMVFHFAGFALGQSKYPANRRWYHDTFLGAGQYASNTWRPTSAVLRVEDAAHPATRNLPRTFRSSPSEWYRWEHDLRTIPDIRILLAVVSTSFPLGIGPKPHEIWHSGSYPIAWTNRKDRMIYFNFGHNDIDYEHECDTTNRTRSYTLGNPVQDRLIVNALLRLGGRTR